MIVILSIIILLCCCYYCYVGFMKCKKWNAQDAAAKLKEEEAKMAE